MQVERETILEMIRARADGDEAARRAEQELPETFDTDDHLGQLEQLGINPEDLQTEGAGSFGQAGRADDQTALQPEEDDATGSADSPE